MIKKALSMSYQIFNAINPLELFFSNLFGKRIEYCIRYWKYFRAIHHRHILLLVLLSLSSRYVDRYCALNFLCPVSFVPILVEHFTGSTVAMMSSVTDNRESKREREREREREQRLLWASILQSRRGITTITITHSEKRIVCSMVVIDFTHVVPLTIIPTVNILHPRTRNIRTTITTLASSEVLSREFWNTSWITGNRTRCTINRKCYFFSVLIFFRSYKSILSQ